MITPKHIGPTAPMALVGLTNVNVDISGIIGQVTIQADLITSTSGRLYFKIDGTATAGATQAAFAGEGYIANGCVQVFNPQLTGAQYLHILVTDSGGVAAVGGALDQILIMKESV